MADESSYFGRVDHANNLLQSMEPDFLGILAEYQRDETELIARDSGLVSKPSPKGLVRRKGFGWTRFFGQSEYAVWAVFGWWITP